jgi:hypothetical protein
MNQTFNKPGIEPWEVVSRKAYWDRDVDLTKWRDRIATGHRSYLPDAIKALHPKEFIHFYGSKAFVRDWPRLRALVPDSVQAYCPFYDLFWSQLAGGGYNLKPYEDYHRMPKRRREFLTAVARHPGKNIYEVAQLLDLQYRRAHDHAMALIHLGRIKGRTVMEGKRRKTKLYPSSLSKESKG